jgi:hypothetical protein
MKVEHRLREVRATKWVMVRMALSSNFDLLGLELGLGLGLVLVIGEGIGRKCSGSV